MEINRRQVQARSIKPLEDDRSRAQVFKKRKQCIMKKAMELATLCGVAVLLVVFRPDGEVETWPKNPTDVKDIIEMTKEYQRDKTQGKRKAVIIEEEIHDDDYDDRVKKRAKVRVSPAHETLVVARCYKTLPPHEESFRSLRESSRSPWSNLTTLHDHNDEAKKENSSKLRNWDMNWFKGLSKESAEELLRLLELKIESIETRLEFMLGGLNYELKDAEDSTIVSLLKTACDGLDLPSNSEEIVEQNTAKGKGVEEIGQVMRNPSNLIELCPPSSSNQRPLYNLGYNYHGMVHEAQQPQQTVALGYVNPTIMLYPLAAFPAWPLNYSVDGDGRTRNFIDKINAVPMWSGEMSEETETEDNSMKTYNYLQFFQQFFQSAEAAGTNDNVNTELRLFPEQPLTFGTDGTINNGSPGFEQPLTVGTDGTINNGSPSSEQPLTLGTDGTINDGSPGFDLELTLGLRTDGIINNSSQGFEANHTYEKI